VDEDEDEGEEEDVLFVLVLPPPFFLVKVRKRPLMTNHICRDTEKPRTIEQ
jgi:hypothetical protein